MAELDGIHLAIVAMVKIGFVNTLYCKGYGDVMFFQRKEAIDATALLLRLPDNQYKQISPTKYFLREIFVKKQGHT